MVLEGSLFILSVLLVNGYILTALVPSDFRVGFFALRDDYSLQRFLFCRFSALCFSVKFMVQCGFFDGKHNELGASIGGTAMGSQ